MMPTIRYLLRPLLGAVLILFSGSVTPASANTPSYGQCVAMVQLNPDMAFDLAMQWEETDTSGGALHCGGLALAALGHFEAAAGRFDKAAQESRDATDVERAAIHRQAAEAWLRAGKGVEAEASISSALYYVPQDPALFYQRARARDLTEALLGALEDVNTALSLEPGRAEALLLRARLHRRLDQPTLANADIEQVLSVAPENVAALLEQGLIFFEQDRIEEAQTVWRRVQMLDSRQGQPGAAAQAAARFLAETEAN